ncbi:MAG: hydantoinase/oxoprolinase family protein, partial [Candidatus Kariarchaeum pelagius]
ANIASILKRPVDTIFSGLAGGFKASEFTSNYLNEPNIISIDIGGTSTDVSSLRNFKGEILNNLKISGHPISRPAVDVETIGAGGGSIVKYTDGLIKIGPESASADPGPISYDKGGLDLTITDINLVMGILPTTLAGGEINLNLDKALRAVDSLSQEINLSINKTISGVRRIFHENIANAIRSVSTQRGYDPRDFVLLAYGGAGPLHAVEIAEIMAISKIVIPPYPGVWSSFGLMGADYEYYSSKSIIKPLKELDQNYLQDCINNLIQELKNKIQLDGIKLETPEINIFLKLRFIGQSYELKVNYIQFTDIKKSFLSKHKLLYGFAAENEPIEVISIEVNYIIKRKYPSLPYFASNKNERYEEIKLHDNTIVKKYSKTNLIINQEYKGPIIIQQDDSTIFIPNTWIFHIDDYGFISIFKN